MNLIFETSVFGARLLYFTRVRRPRSRFTQKFLPRKCPAPSAVVRKRYQPPLHGVGAPYPRREQWILPSWFLHHEV